MARRAATLTSTEYTGPLTVAPNPNRSYFFIVVKSGTVDIEFGNGGGKIPLPTGGNYEPLVCPTGSYAVTGSGTYVIAEG